MAKKEYSNGEITVVWDSPKCIHSTKCFKGLPEVFNPEARPWVNIEGAKTEEIRKQVELCPSGALSYYFNKEKKNKETLDMSEENTKVEPLKNGPLMVYGEVTLKNQDGEEEKLNKKATAFCRCGGSNNKPYCDGNHAKIDFEG